MNDLERLMSDKDIIMLKEVRAELKEFMKNFLILKNMLFNDWRRAKELLSKISNDQHKVDVFGRQIDKTLTNINKLIGE